MTPTRSVPRRAVALWFLTALLSAQAPAIAQAPPAPLLLPIEHYTRPNDVEQVSLSPSGKRLAVVSTGPDSIRRLGIMDVDPRSDLRTVASHRDADVANALWVNDDRIAYEVFQHGAAPAPGSGGIFAVDHDGQHERPLVDWQNEAYLRVTTRLPPHLLPHGWRLSSAIDDGGDDVFMAGTTLNTHGEARTEWVRLDTRSGTVHRMSDSLPAGTTKWFRDAAAEPRLATARQNGENRLLWRAPRSTQWEVVNTEVQFPEADIVPVALDGETILVSSRAGGELDALFRFDPVTKRLDDQPVAAIDGFDLYAGADVDTQTRRLVGLHVRTERETSRWLDPTLADVQRSVDALLPAGRSNHVSCGRCGSSRFFTVLARSDRQPGEYHLFDKERRSLAYIGARRPWISEPTQATRTFHRITARGYLVVQPEFRGSMGYGLGLYRAGWAQWGQAMQDDLVDAVRWAVREQSLDASRVCIAGMGGYGGYAALMGPIADPGVFRCAAAYAPQGDLGLMFAAHPGDPTDEWHRAMRVLLGDVDKDAARLAKASPLRRAAEIEVPLLVGDGGGANDAPGNSGPFVAAARHAGVQMETVVYPREGHDLVRPDDLTDWFGRLERFFARSLRDASSQ